MRAGERPPVVGIVGLGLIGGSLARALVERGGEVVATTRSAGARVGAAEAGVTIVDDVAAVVATADVVVLAVPLPVLEATLAEVVAAVDALPADRPRPTVTDVGSVKAPIAGSAPALALGGAFVPGHPMAGTEHAGWGAADRDLFVGRRWALVVDAPVALDRWAAVARVAIGVGAEVVPVGAAEHDDAVALVSHLPYVLAAVAAGLVADERSGLARSLAAGSFDSLTRVAGGADALGADMATTNARPLATQARDVARYLDGVADQLEGGAEVAPTHRPAAVEAIFEAGHRGRRALDGRGAGEARAEAVLDAAGLLALGRRGGRVVAVEPAPAGAGSLPVTVVEPGVPS